MTQAPEQSADASYPLAGALIVKARDIMVSLVTCIASLLVVAFFVAGHIDIREALLLHLGVVAVPVLFLAYNQRCGNELTVATLLSVGTLVAGPIGAVGTLVIALSWWYRRPDAERLRDWYDSIAGFVVRGDAGRIHDEVTSGRLSANPAAGVDRLALLLSGASVEEQQRVVGVIGRQYHEELRPLLRAALRNRNPIIRAQAAAVASRLDLDEKNHLWGPALDQAPINDTDARSESHSR
jgi:hypothetical protein